MPSESFWYDNPETVRDKMSVSQLLLSNVAYGLSIATDLDDLK